MTRIQNAGVLLIAGVVVAILWSPVVDPFVHRERYRGQVLALYENLQPGMTKQQVQHVMDSGEYPDLRFHRADAEKWSGAAPLEFGAGNWVLLVEFLGDHVSGLRVRTADGDHDHPAEAPSDKTSSSNPRGSADRDPN